jgi:hypothetical protein
MTKQQAITALQMGHAIRHKTSLPNSYFFTREVEKKIMVESASDKLEEGETKKKRKEVEKTYTQTEVFDELNQSMGTPKVFFKMKGLQMHETDWSISTTSDLNHITKQPKTKNGEARK